jgi:hypothetical protein
MGNAAYTALISPRPLPTNMRQHGTPQGRQFEPMDVSRNISSAAYAVGNASHFTGAPHLIPEEPSLVGATTTSHSKREQSGSDGSSARGSKSGSGGGSARGSKSGSKSGSGGGSSIGSRGERIAGLLGLGSVFIQVLGQQPYRSGHLERCVLDGRRGHRRGQRVVASRGLCGVLVAGGRFLRGCVLRPCI